MYFFVIFVYFNNFNDISSLLKLRGIDLNRFTVKGS